MSIASALYGDVDVTKVMFGQEAVHVPINIICQPMGDGKVTGVFQTSAGLPLLRGSARSHILLIGDMVFRPRIACASDEFRGSGLAALAQHGFMELPKWLRGDVLLGPSEEELAQYADRPAHG